MKKHQSEISWSEEDLAYVAWVPGLPDRKARGESPEQALARLQALIEERPLAPSPEQAAPETAVPSEAGARKRREKPKLTRLEAASRQLDAAISLFFAAGDPLAVHALATAAGELFADRVARWNGEAVGDSLPREAYLRTLKEARTLCRTIGGEEALAFDPSGNDALIAQAIADRLAACPSRPLSREMAAFRDWYRAARSPEVLAEAPAAVHPRRRAISRPLPGSFVQFSLLPETL
ncbi:MAG: hypothetical protein PHU46_05610 [Rhodocyclaceae bacterium]|nr:hypothetical protein [Rhodocyclaceae bacterium]